ncbi:hypothetical protein [Microbacterium radiodurans]|uniref:Uncharacterized protein n=1 Tax=Microbacterium radiodurans TaxID=661398 RepID=A0A5J5ITF0_9MICO|nr:hypothetical protein [Microbacterium radiodurans]KAA9086614.1 hypothetical protein F6B42_06245 [Microbacterium radiodurans]
MSTDDPDVLAESIGRAVLAAARVPQSADSIGAPLDVDAHLRLVAASSRAEADVRMLLHRSITAARAGGASWARIGSELGMSRQAAQQRFGAEPGSADVSAAPPGEERWLGPVTAFDELPELDAAGRQGWHTVGVGMLAHRMLRTGTQWEHRRILWRVSLESVRAEGWEIGCRAFPWVYLVRDLGVAAEPA